MWPSLQVLLELTWHFPESLQLSTAQTVLKFAIEWLATLYGVGGGRRGVSKFMPVQEHGWPVPSGPVVLGTRVGQEVERASKDASPQLPQSFSKPEPG